MAADATGTVYVTDTGRNKLYKVQGGPTLVVVDSALGAPNGITWDAANKRFIIVPFGGAHSLRAWVPGTTTLTDVGTSTGAKWDGVEVLAGWTHPGVEPGGFEHPHLRRRDGARDHPHAGRAGGHRGGHEAESCRGAGGRVESRGDLRLAEMMAEMRGCGDGGMRRECVSAI